MLSKDEITARSLRLAGRAPNPYTGTLNDPFEEAQSRYSGPGWDQFFGGLQKTEEDAQLAGKNYRVNWGGFGNAVDDGGGMARARRQSLAAMDAGYGNTGAEDLNPLEQQAQKNFILSQQANAAIEQARAERDALNERNDAVAERTNARLGKSYDDFVLSSAFVPASPITRTPINSPTPIDPAKHATEAYTAEPARRLTADEMLLRSVPASQKLGVEKTLQEMALKRQDSDLALRKQQEVERENKAKDAQNAPFVAPVDASGTPLTGQAALAALPTAKQKVVQAVLDGRQAIPSGAALKDPYWKGVIETANLVDPNFDTVNFNSRNKTRQDFTSGASKKQIDAINTVAGHLHDLASEGDKLGNFGFNWMNTIYNKLTKGGSERGVTLNNFETLKEGVANELMRTWRQVGAGSEKEIEDWKAQIGATKSPEELRGAFKTIGKMLDSKLGSMDYTYKQGMGTDAVSAVSPESRKKLDDLQGIGADAPAQPRKSSGGPKADPLGIRR